MLFCVDTSGWLDGWQRHYPPDVFPTFWQKIDERVFQSQIISSEEVYVELVRMSEDLHKWVQVRKQMLAPLDEKIQRRVMELLGQFPRLGIH